MHLKRVTIHPEKFPTTEHYPFNLNIFHETKSILFNSPVTFFVGENGTGKSTLLEAMTHKCGIYMGKRWKKTLQGQLIWEALTRGHWCWMDSRLGARIIFRIPDIPELCPDSWRMGSSRPWITWLFRGGIFNNQISWPVPHVVFQGSLQNQRDLFYGRTRDSTLPKNPIRFARAA